MAKASKPVQRAAAARNNFTVGLNDEARALIAAEPKLRADKAAHEAFTLHVEQIAKRIGQQPTVSEQDILTLAVATSMRPGMVRDLLEAVIYKAAGLQFKGRGLHARLAPR